MVRVRNGRSKRTEGDETAVVGKVEGSKTEIQGDEAEDEQGEG
jgi:hypothetical protein